MTVRVYRSTDTSAPVLTGSAGSLTALLDAVLVNGYGTQTAAGWTKPFSTTNKAAYKQNITGANNSSGMYLYVDDTGPGVGAAKEARASGFETMSAITPAGTGQFPTSAQSTVGTGQLVIRKSNTADATARAWTCVANGQTIYLFIESGDNSAPIAATTFIFGDFKSFKASDQYAVCIIGRTSENSGSSAFDSLQAYGWGNSGGNNVLGVGATCMGHFVARSWTGTGGSIRVGKPADWGMVYGGQTSGQWGNYINEAQTSMSGLPQASNVTSGRFNSVYQWPAPNGPDGALVLVPTWIGHSSSKRGYLPGIWTVMHDRPLGHNDTFTVIGGNLNGKSMLAQNFQATINGSANAENGVIVVETSDTWG